MPSQVDISQIGVPNVREKKSVHKAAWTQAKAELDLVLQALVPEGGGAGNVLTKLTSADYDFGWVAPSGGGGGGAPLERITPEAQGFPGGSGDASSYVQAAINSAKDDPTKVLWLSGTYYVNALTCDKNIKISGGGLLRPFAEPTVPLLKVAVAPQLTSAIVGFLNTTIDLDFAFTIDTQTTRVQVADVTGYVAGMPCRITSENLNPRVTNNTNYIAANATIISVQTPYLYLDRVIQNTSDFATNPKIHVWDERVTTDISDLRFFVDRTAAWVTDEWDYDFLWLEGLAAPRVERLRFENITNSGLSLVGCIAADVHTCDFRSGRNRSDLAIPGYGVQDLNGYLNRVRNCFFSNLRHGYTTIGSNSTGTPANPWLFGGCHGCQIFDNNAVGCASAAFDTHDDGQFIVFGRCNAYGGWATTEAAYSGFQLRGDSNILFDCSAIDTEYGVILHNNSSAESPNGPHILQSLRIKSRNAAIRVRPTEQISAIIRECDLTSRVDRQIDVGKGDLKVINTRSRGLGSTTFSHFVLSPGAGTAKIDVEDCIFDTLGSTGTNNRIVQTTGAACDIRVVRSNVLSTVAQGWAAAVFSTDGEDLTSAHFDILADRAPSNPSGFHNIGANTPNSGRVRVDDGRSGDTSIVSVSSSGGNRTLSEHRSINAPHVIILFTCTTALTTLTAALDARLRNQLVTIVNRKASTQNLAIANDSANGLEMLATITLVPGAAVTLAWNQTDTLFNLASSNITASGGGGTIDIKIDGSTVASGQSAIDFEADHFDYTSGQIKIDASISRNLWLADQDADNHTIVDLITKNLQDTIQAASVSAGAITLDPTLGNIITTTQSENITSITLANFPTGGWIEWWLTRTGSHTITFPASTRWEGGSPPTLSGSGNVDKFFIVKRGSLYDWSVSQGYPST